MSAQIYYLGQNMLHKPGSEELNLRLEKTHKYRNFPYELFRELGVDSDYSIDDAAERVHLFIPIFTNKAELKKAVAFIEHGGAPHLRDSFAKYFDFKSKRLKRNLKLGEVEKAAGLVVTALQDLRLAIRDVVGSYSFEDCAHVSAANYEDPELKRIEGDPPCRRKFLYYKHIIKKLARKNSFLARVEKLSPDYLDDNEIEDFNYKIRYCLGEPDVNAMTAKIFSVLGKWADFERALPRMESGASKNEDFARNAVELMNRKPMNGETYESYVGDAFGARKFELILKVKEKYGEFEGEIDYDSYQTHLKDVIDFTHFSLIMKAKTEIGTLLAAVRSTDALDSKEIQKLAAELERHLKTWPRSCEGSWRSAVKLEEAYNSKAGSSGRRPLKTLDEALKTPNF